MLHSHVKIIQEKELRRNKPPQTLTSPHLVLASRSLAYFESIGERSEVSGVGRRLRERRETASGELKWSVIRTAFAVGTILAIAGWLAVHSQRGDAARSADTTPYAVTSEDWPYAAAADGQTAQRQQQQQQQQQQPQQPSQSQPNQTPKQEQTAPKSADEPSISVYLSDKHTVENVPLDEYVLGVVAAEMPLDFEPAALEAQALAARTYIVRRLLSDNRDGVPGNRALVTDQVTHQVYLSVSEMKQLRKSNPEGVSKAEQAVHRTRNQVLTYDGWPIEALFFSASNGYTENSEEVFPNKLPYLRAVASPWDNSDAHRTQETVTMTLTQFYEKLGVAVTASSGLNRSAKKPAIRLLDRTEGHRVRTLRIGSETFTGEEVRAKLGLRSASFEWSVKDGEIRITTVGNGHGVGMSQWGAEGMAKAGSSARQIVEHYYTGVGLAEASKLLERQSRNAKLYKLQSPIFGHV